MEITKIISILFLALTLSQAQDDTRPVLRVVTILNPPFAMIKDGPENRTGNDQFEGLMVDLIDEISRRVGFQYELYLSPDGAYGWQNENGTWNGMIGELVNKRADLALSDLTMTNRRMQAVRYSTPYMQSGIGLLHRKPLDIPNPLLINNVEDLVNSSIRYGMLGRGSTNSFFQQSNDTIIKRLLTNMKADPTVFTKSNLEGVQKVEEGYQGYAYFMDSYAIDYITERYCHLIKVGQPLNTYYYGIATPKDSQWMEQISSAIVDMLWDNKIANLIHKWWRVERGGGHCGGVDVHAGK